MSVLVAKASTTCTATYKVTQADMDNGSLSDTATVTGTPPGNGTPVTSPPSSVTITVSQIAHITIITTAGVAYYTKAGNVIPYTFLVTNTGNVTLTAVSVKSFLVGLSKITCPTKVLSVGQTMACTASYLTTGHDVKVGSVNNVAVASGQPPIGGRTTSNLSGVKVPAIHKHVHVTG